jgi:hypothetical protein
MRTYFFQVIPVALSVRQHHGLELAAILRARPAQRRPMPTSRRWIDWMTPQPAYFIQGARNRGDADLAKVARGPANVKPCLPSQPETLVTGKAPRTPKSRPVQGLQKTMSRLTWVGDN